MNCNYNLTRAEKEAIHNLKIKFQTSVHILPWTKIKSPPRNTIYLAAFSKRFYSYSTTQAKDGLSPWSLLLAKYSIGTPSIIPVFSFSILFPSKIYNTPHISFEELECVVQFPFYLKKVYHHTDKKPTNV